MEYMLTMFASNTKKRKNLFFSFFRNTVYKFYLKLIKTDIIEKTFIKYKNIYVNDTDTTFIINKNGSQLKINKVYNTHIEIFEVDNNNSTKYN